MKPIVESQILVNLPIINGSETYRYWKDPPVHPTMFMYFFNLTNQHEFLQGKLLVVFVIRSAIKYVEYNNVYQ